jgi:hypothetical protein
MAFRDIGITIMKMMRRTSSTSIIGVTLISLLRFVPPLAVDIAIISLLELD